MPRGGFKSSQSSAARAMVNSMGSPASLSSFLGGFSTNADGAAADAESESEYVVNLKLLSKTSEITKQKAFEKLLLLMRSTSEEVLLQYSEATAETVIQHAQHPKPAIRAFSFQLLQALMSHGTELKKKVAPQLKVLAGLWVMGMNDMEQAVSRAAAAAFDAAFAADKKTRMLQQFMEAILDTLRNAVVEVMAIKKPLQDDALDPNANKLFAALKAMGYVIKQVSAAQPAVLKFVQDPESFGALIPARNSSKSYLLFKTPLARSAVLALLRDVVTICPATPKIHKLVSQALVGAILDPNVAVASRTWELLLFWCRTNVSDVVSNMQPGCLDDVVNSFMDCQQAELAEVIYPCLFPLLTSLSKDSRCEGMLDEFCAALVEKLHQVTETPNVSARDLTVFLSALLECWELHCVRKKNAGAPADSVELFTVICFNVVLLMQSDAKAARYQATVIHIMTKSLLKTGGRCEDIFKQCIDVVAARPSAAFRVLPDAPSAIEQRSFDRFQGRLFGHLCATLSAPSAPSPSPSPSPTPANFTTAKPDVGGSSGTTTNSSTARCKAVVFDASNTWLMQQVLTSGSSSGAQELRYEPLASFFEETQGTSFCPSNDVADSILAALSAHLRDAPAGDAAQQQQQQQQQSEGTAENASLSSSAHTATLATLVTTALEWRHRPAAHALVEATSATQEVALKEAALRHLLQDPAKLFDVFTHAVARLDADQAERCMLQYTQCGACLSGEQREAVKKALRSGLKELLAQLTEEAPGTGEEEDEGSDDSSSSSSDATLSSGEASSDPSVSSSSSASADSNDDGVSAKSSSLSSENSAQVENCAPVVQQTLLRWMPLLRAGSDLAELIALSKEDVVATLLTPLTYLTVALAPRAYPEQFLSVKAMRVALKTQQQHSTSAAVASDNDADKSGEDVVMSALDAKKHGLSIGEVAAFTERVTDLLDSYGVTREERDAVAMATLRGVLDCSDALPLCFFADHQLFQLAPFASTACLQSFVTAESVWQQTAMAVDTAALVLNETALTLYDGYLTLDLLQPRFSTLVRTGQLIRLMDSVGGPEAAVAMATEDPKAVAHLFCELVRVAAGKEALADAACHTLFVKVIPAMFACFDVAAVAVEVAAQLTSAEPSGSGPVFPYLLPTLAAVLRDIATAEDTVFLRRAMRLVSAVANAAVSALFTAEGARGIAAPLALAYTTFFAVMDEAADMLRFNIAAQLPAEQERLLLEASCQLPTWDLTTAKLTLVVVRHLASLPAVADSTVRSLMQYAARQTPLAGLEVLAELACTRIPTPEVYSELIRVIVDALCRSHRLRHLPPNGRLQRESGGSLTAGAPVALTTLRRVVMAAVLARRGVVLHSRMDSVLRSTVNLVVFDAVCEAVSRLRMTKEAEVAPLAKLIAFTSRFMGDLLTGDVQTLRASEVSVEKIASVLNFAYAWLFATGITKLELLGLSTVAGVMRSVCLLANLTLMRSTVSLRAAMQAIMQRSSLKPLREEFSTAEPAKVTLFRQQNAVLAKTHKQKMLLFPYLLSWCVFLTTPPPPAAAAADEAQPSNNNSSGGNSGSTSRDKEWQRQVYTLLDLLFTLMLTPLENGRRLDETFIGASVHPSPTADASATGQLGFEVVALTRVDASNQMAQLARGAFAVFTQLLHGPTLALTKIWLETIERKGRALFYDSVGQHISGILIQESFMSVLSHSPDGSSSFTVGEGCNVEVNVAQQLIDITYEMEDAKVAVRITFPAAFPLRPPVVEYESGRECGVSTKKWRAWMLKMSVILFGGSANVWECIDLFHQNLEAHFRGIEPCPICFAVVSAVTHKLPDVRCSVCHNSAFHSNCLYTWWASGFNNVCPLCRSPWIAE